MSKDQKNITKRDHTDRRQFAYSRNNVNLSFTLRTDIKQELKDFAELLKEAEKDVLQELNSK